MKYFILSLVLFSSTISFSQEFRSPDEWGTSVFDENEELFGESERAEIRMMLDANRSRFIKEGILEFEESKKTGTFAWPVGPANGLDVFSIYVIPRFVDHDTSYPDQLLDYNGGERTYDRTNGYNHKGTDITVWPYNWLRMDNDQAGVFAVESGVILGKYDGNYDRNCESGSGSSNAFFIQHGNYEVWYSHLKNGSLNEKSVGDTVQRGELLGIAGSSGSSTGPHLHIEMFDTAGNIIDPFAGPHNPTIMTSLWENQPPYYDPQVNYISTNFTRVDFEECPNPEVPNESTTFSPGDTVYTYFFFRDMLDTLTSYITLYTPSGIVRDSWTYSISDKPHYTSYWASWWFSRTSDWEAGEWTLSIEFNGEVYEHTFNVEPVGIDKTHPATPEQYSLKQNYPNPFNPVTVISYNIAEPSDVKLVVYDALGNELDVLVHEKKPAGRYSVRFDGSGFSSGTYFVKMTAGEYSSAIKMILIK